MVDVRFSEPVRKKPLGTVAFCIHFGLAKPNSNPRGLHVRLSDETSWKKFTLEMRPALLKSSTFETFGDDNWLVKRKATNFCSFSWFYQLVIQCNDQHVCCFNDSNWIIEYVRYVAEFLDDHTTSLYQHKFRCDRIDSIDDWSPVTIELYIFRFNLAFISFGDWAHSIEKSPPILTLIYPGGGGPINDFFDRYLVIIFGEKCNFAKAIWTYMAKYNFCNCCFIK